jgi:hypothetical protein
MYPLYKDIRQGMGVPKWIDKHGVPRYSGFNPKDAAEIYNDWVVLMEVECQSCQKTFRCATSLAWYQEESTIEEVMNHLFGWGDAPWHDADGNEAGFESQCAGTTMSTKCIAVELWHKVMSEWREMEIPETYTKWEEE